MQHATFYFHGRLNDFLPKRQKHTRIQYTFRTPSSLKDTIEAMGVPHVEVRKVAVNGSEKGFHHLLQANDNVEVFAYENHLPDSAPVAFVLDVHLGKLARLLRMLGFDTVYQNNLNDSEMVAIALAQNRAVLTRDVGLLKHKVLTWGYWLRSQVAEEQLLEVINMFLLCSQLNPFTRCIACNGNLQAVQKQSVAHLLPNQTKKVFDEFYQCQHCSKVYWKGSHYQNMLQLVARIRLLAC